MTKTKYVEGLIDRLESVYINDPDENDTCYSCGQLINSEAGKLCADCLEQSLALALNDPEQAKEMHNLCKALRSAVNARNALAKSLIAQTAAKESKPA